MQKKVLTYFFFSYIMGVVERRNATMKNIKRLRAKTNMSQDELAKKVGVSRTTMNTWENTLSWLSEDNEKKLIDIFGCSVYELYGMDEFKHYPKETESKIGIILMLYNLLDKEDKEKLIDMIQEKVDE